MQTVKQTAEKLSALLAQKFATVRVSALSNPEQFLHEIRAINPSNLPGVIIVYDGGSFSDENTMRTERMTLIVLDRFRSGSDDRALELLANVDKVLELIPPDGVALDGVYVTPEDCNSCSNVADFAALAIGIVVRQGN